MFVSFCWREAKTKRCPLSLGTFRGPITTGLSWVFLGQWGRESILFKGKHTFQSEMVPLTSHSATLTHEAAEFITSGHHLEEEAPCLHLKA